MNLDDLIIGDTQFIVIDSDDKSCSLITRGQLNEWLKRGDICIGDTVLEVTVSNQFVAKQKIELTSTIFKES